MIVAGEAAVDVRAVGWFDCRFSDRPGSVCRPAERHAVAGDRIAAAVRVVGPDEIGLVRPVPVEPGRAGYRPSKIPALIPGHVSPDRIVIRECGTRRIRVSLDIGSRGQSRDP